MITTQVNVHEKSYICPSTETSQDFHLFHQSKYENFVQDWPCLNSALDKLAHYIIFAFNISMYFHLLYPQKAPTQEKFKVTASKANPKETPFRLFLEFCRHMISWLDLCWSSKMLIFSLGKTWTNTFSDEFSKMVSKPFWSSYSL